MRTLHQLQRSRRPVARVLPRQDMTVAQVTLRAVFVTCVALSCLAASSALAQGTSSAQPASASVALADAAYDRAAKKWSTLQSVSAEFEQRITNPLLRRTATSRGTFLQQRPGKVAITFVDPVGDRIVSDGKFLWVYLPSSAPGQVMKLPANADGAIIADMLGQLLDTPRRTFIISGGEAATIEGRATRRVQLVPRTAGAVAFQRATLWIDERESRPVRVQIIDPQGVDRTITLTTWTPNATVAKDAFQFTVPKGAKVVTKLPG